MNQTINNSYIYIYIHTQQRTIRKKCNTTLIHCIQFDNYIILKFNLLNNSNKENFVFQCLVFVKIRNIKVQC